MPIDKSDNGESFNERRVCPRFRPQTPVQVNLNSLGADETYPDLNCLDLSETGLKLSCALNRKLPFRDNSLIEVRLPTATDYITFLTRIQREQEQEGQRQLVLRIVQIGVRDKELLRHLIHSRTVFTRGHLPLASSST